MRRGEGDNAQVERQLVAATPCAGGAKLAAKRISASAVTGFRTPVSYQENGLLSCAESLDYHPRGMRARAATRTLLSVGLLALLAVAWRGQWAFQFVLPRSTGGWWLLGAMVALFVLWLLTERLDGKGSGDLQAMASGARRRGSVAPYVISAGDPKVAATRAEWIFVSAICALGIAFRTIYFRSVPGGMNHDAAFNGMYALHVLQGAPYTPYVSAAWGRETLFMYLCTPLVAWFGNVPEAIQLAGTLVGIATLPLFYLLARAVCGRRIGMVALAFLAVSGWHGLFSRVGWRMLMVPLFEVVALFGLWRALETGRRGYWLLTGASAALAIYTYDAGRVIPLMVGIMLTIFFIAERRHRRVRLLGAVVVIITFLFVGGPMLWYAATHFEQFKARAAHLAGEEKHPTLLPTAVATAAMFNYRGNGNDFFVDEPLLEPLTAVLFVIGFLVAMTRVLGLWRPRSAAYGAIVLSDRRPLVFILIGLAMALLPGLLSIPNGNRCIPALPFVYLLIAIGAVTLVDAIARPLGERTRETARVVLLAALIALAGVETYREYLGTHRRPVLGFGPEATAAGEYLRGFGDGYTRYVISEDWPEYTLAYLSYNGGGTPLENHYVLGRRLEDIEPRINRYGRKGLVFLTDLKPAGRHALERLQRLFAEHRIESVRAPRLGGEQVAQALIVEPQGAGRTGLWSNTTRALSLGGDAAATALACFDAVGDAQGVSVRLQLMRPDPCAANGGAPAARGGEVRVLASCPPDENAAPLAVGFSADGLEVRAPASGRDGAAVTAVDAAAVEPGRWYEVAIAVRPDGGMSVSVDGNALPGADRLQAAGAPLRIVGAEISAPAGEHLFVDDLAVVPGLVRPGAALWAEAKNAFHEDFETLPYGLIAADAEWRRVEGPVSALASPAAAQAAAPAAEGGNAFDGGRGSGGGEFNDPVGMTVDPDGHLYVADKNNHRVQQFDRAGGFLRAWGEKGDQPGMFNEPHDVAADAEFVYVADTWNQRVQVFDHSGAHVFTITGVPSLTSPRGVFVKDKLIYIAEAGAGRVTVYDRGGKLRRTIGVLGGDAPGHLIEPVAVAVDRAGDVWVVNSGNNRIEHFAPDGTVRGSIPVPGWTDPRLKESYLAVGDDGTLYLGDWDRGAVRRLRPDGTELAPLGTSIRKPSGVVVERNRVLVVARGEDVVRVLPLDAGGGT